MPALEIFFMLLLFCQGDISEKIMTAFSVGAKCGVPLCTPRHEL